MLAEILSPFLVPLQQLVKTRHPVGPWNVLPDFAAIASLQQLPGSLEKKRVELLLLGTLDQVPPGISATTFVAACADVCAPLCRSRLETDLVRRNPAGAQRDAEC